MKKLMRLKWRDKPMAMRVSSCEEKESQRRATQLTVRFSTEDYGNPHSHISTLKAINARNAEFWRRK
jgi:hypothetical protein